MKVKRVNRYYCDHCGKGSCASGHMRKHELHCTMNPDRACGVCSIMQSKQAPISQLVALFPKREEYPTADPMIGDPDIYSEEYINALKEAFSKLRKRTNNCPACILAAVRQAKTNSWIAMDMFNFKDEMKAMFDKLNNREGAQY